ncbi:uncharacterized protein BDZ99DRAFT_513800 [Mytilinidion resinicola]|uniref:Protein kinase domain-containing protein n=1 Tax=Mytilinidion resinicola TaxID=574789 RepID=A0A6A6Z8W6_9PEZI|nr:uncharacterized protein BDZ99DRAFT_513800 [Mytilinidion resinicola]KAF2817562.1 hypothetical protein BDZ99DRAFT_513800 [Mytilinidion resinicola]
MAHGPPADVWSLGVMALKWLYGIPAPRQTQKSMSSDQWRSWAKTWVDALTAWLDDQESGKDVDMLQGMLVLDQTKRLTARKCLMMGFKNRLFERRAVDGLVECVVDGAEAADDLAGGDEAPARTPQADAEDDPEATIILS